jgi:ParB family chromosome partitioning protein
MQPEFRNLPLDKLHESPTNPRRYFNEEALLELSANIKRHGVLLPLLVRKNESGFEIVSGGRRFRAARLAELTEVPVRVRELTDEQVLEIQVIENLHREDIHPIEEAEGFQALIDKYGYTAILLAERCNRSESYILKRLSLARLIGPAKDDFLKGNIELGHAILLCRLEEKDQKRCLEALFEKKTRWNPESGKNETVGVTVGSVSELKLMIEQEILLDLAAAPWLKDDADLLPQAGACTTCAKRTGSNLALFDDTKRGDHCLDRHCWHKKMYASIARTEGEFAANGQALVRIASTNVPYGDEKKFGNPLHPHSYIRIQDGKKLRQCDNAESGLIVHGPRLGFVIEICRAANCKVHRPQRSAGTYGSGAGDRPERSFAEEWEEKKRKLEERIDLESRRALFRAIAESGPAKLDIEALRLVIERLADRAGHDGCKAICEALGFEAKKEGHSVGYKDALEKHAGEMKTVAQLSAFAFTLCQAHNLVGWRDSIRGLRKAAGQLGLKPSSIEKAVADPLRAAFAKKEAAAKIARKAAAARKKKGRQTKAAAPDSTAAAPASTGDSEPRKKNKRGARQSDASSDPEATAE